MNGNMQSSWGMVRLQQSHFYPFILLVTVVCLWIAPAKAQTGDDWQAAFLSWAPITDADWNPDLTWLKSKPDAVRIFERVYTDEQKAYNLESGRQEYIRTRIFTEKGKRDASIAFMYAPKLDKITDIRARTVFPDGRISSYSKNDILSLSRNVPGMKGTDSLVFTFPDIDTNCIVEYYISMKQVKLENRVYTYADVPVQKQFPALSFEYTWAPAPSVGPDESYTYLGDPFWFWAGASKEIESSTMTAREGRTFRIFARHIPGWTAEPYSLPDTCTMAEIIRFYCRNAYPTDARDKIATGYAQHDMFVLSSKEQQKLHQLADRFRGLPSQTEKIQAVYSWLQDSIVNVSYYAKPPYRLGLSQFSDYKRVTDALDQRYGDWEAIEALFCDILRDLGFEAYPMLMPNRSERVFWPQAGFFQYTRFIIAVKDSSSGYQFYSPGDWGLPAGMMHWAHEAADGIICSDPPVMTRTSFSPPSRNEMIRSWSLTVKNDFPVEGKLVEFDANHKARLLKVGLIGSEPDRAKQRYTDSLTQILPGAKVTMDYIHVDSTALVPVTSGATIVYPGTISAEAGEITLVPFKYTGDSENPFSSPDRVNEIVFTYAWHLVDTVRLEFGQPISSIKVPTDTTISTIAGSCSVTFSTDSTGVTAIRDFTVNRPRFAVSEYSEVRDLFKARAKLSGQAVKFRIK